MTLSVHNTRVIGYLTDWPLMGPSLTIAGIALGLMILAVWLQRRRREVQEQPHAMVWLLRAPRELNQANLSTLVERALDIKLGAPDYDAMLGAPVNDPNEPPPSFVVEEPPGFVVVVRGWTYQINLLHETYMPDPEAAAQEIDDPLLRQAVAEHCAWISVDSVEGGIRMSADGWRQVYQVMGRLAAALYGDDCLALYLSAHELLRLADADLLTALRSSDPVAALRDPVIDVPLDDQEMAAAQAEARRRWPEFVQAFQRRSEGQDFAVKSPFLCPDGEEYMWVKVEWIDGDHIRGALDSHPVEFRELKAGDRVEVRASQINDWAYKSGETTHGGFTIKILQERA